MVSKEEKPPLTPETTFCPNYDCPARGQVGEGNIGVHSQKDRRYICRECGKTFSATTGTVFYRLRKGADLITLVVKLLSHGCSIQAIVFAFGLDERTVKNWFEKSGRHSQAVQERLVERPRPLGQVQCDELRIKLQGAVIWMGLAMMTQTRLWLSRRSQRLSRRRIDWESDLSRQTLRLGARRADSLLCRWPGELSEGDLEGLSRERASIGNGAVSLGLLAQHLDRAGD